MPNSDPNAHPSPSPTPGYPGGENASPAASSDPTGDKKVGPAGTGHDRLRSGLSIDYDHYGADYDRYRWAQDERKIVIHLDHPVVKLAKDLPDDEATYRRLIWEIAFTAYAVALADLQFERDPARDSSDATFEIREALRRVWAHASTLYAVERVMGYASKLWMSQSDWARRRGAHLVVTNWINGDV